MPHHEETSQPESEGYVERSGEDPEKGLQVPTYGEEAEDVGEAEGAGYPYPERQAEPSEEPSLGPGQGKGVGVHGEAPAGEADPNPPA